MKIKENEWRNKYLDLARELKKAMEHEGDGDTDCNWCTRNNPQRIEKGTGRFRNQRMSRDHPNDSIVKIGQYTEKSSGDLKKLAITQTPLKDYQLALIWKTRK